MALVLALGPGADNHVGYIASRYLPGDPGAYCSSHSQ